VDAGKGDVAYGEQEGRRRCGVGVRRGHWMSWSGDAGETWMPHETGG
jgi:hypothetical protein